MALTIFLLRFWKNVHFLKTNNLSTRAMNPSKSAGVIIIGNEILKGDVLDTNSSHVIRGLYQLGVKLKKISVIGDDVNDLCDEVRLFSKNYDYVITSGGIGPTHDDVTFEAVAKAFNEPLVLNPDLRKLCELFYKTSDINHPGMKLALVPKPAKLTYIDDSCKAQSYPNVSVHNVYMFPGIPQFFLKSFDSLSGKLFKSATVFYTKCIYLNVTEDQISNALNNLVGEFPDVQFGSYPKLFDESYKVKVTIESTNKILANEACNKFLQTMPQKTIVAVK